MSKSVLPSLFAFAVLTATPLLASADSNDTRAEQVHYTDLNLQTSNGSRKLYKRIAAAADYVCRDLSGRDLARMKLREQCKEDAIARAVSDVNQPMLTAYYNTQTHGNVAATSRMQASAAGKSRAVNAR